MHIWMRLSDSYALRQRTSLRFAPHPVHVAGRGWGRPSSQFSRRRCREGARARKGRGQRVARAGRGKGRGRGGEEWQGRQGRCAAAKCQGCQGWRRQRFDKCQLHPTRCSRATLHPCLRVLPIPRVYQSAGKGGVDGGKGAAKGKGKGKGDDDVSMEERKRAVDAAAKRDANDLISSVCDCP